MSVTASLIQTRRSTFRLRDMLLSGPLLERTGADVNPFLVYAGRRARRPWRFVFMRLFEGLLVFWCYQIIRHLSAEQASELIPSDSEIAFINSSWTVNLLFVAGFYLPIPIAVFTFLLLRYNLMANNVANHIKKLSRENLAELLLTDLNGEEYFLQLFLSFCRSYRVPIVWAVVAVAACTAKFLSGLPGFRWTDSVFVVVVGTLNIVMLTWIAAVGQFALEWKWFAGGGRARHLRPFLSVSVSGVLAAAIAWYSLLLIEQDEFIQILPICVATWAAALYVVYQIGLWVDYDSEWQLWRRLNPKDPDEMRTVTTDLARLRVEYESNAEEQKSHKIQQM